jgi:hypothetical protein
MHTDGRIDLERAIQNAISALGRPCRHQKDDHLIAKAVCRLGFDNGSAAQRLALLGLLAGRIKVFELFHLIAAPARPFLAPAVDLCAFYSNPYRRPELNGSKSELRK